MKNRRIKLTDLSSITECYWTKRKSKKEIWELNIRCLDYKKTVLATLEKTEDEFFLVTCHSAQIFRKLDTKDIKEAKLDVRMMLVEDIINSIETVTVIKEALGKMKG